MKLPKKSCLSTSLFLRYFGIEELYAFQAVSQIWEQISNFIVQIWWTAYLIKSEMNFWKLEILLQI